MSEISDLAYIEKGARIGVGVTIEPFAVIKKNVVLKDGVCVKSHAYIDGHTEIGEGSIIWPGASLGTKPQDLKYKGEKTFVTIGRKTEIREFVTVNASCGEGTTVSIGDNCLIMAYCHVAHNCQIGSHVIMANNSQLAGHVTIEDFAIIGGMTPVHQFVRIGKHAMVGGMSRVSYDVPPFTIGSGAPYRIRGLNIVGLKRHKFSLKRRVALNEAFKMVYKSEDTFANKMERLKTITTPD